MMRDADSATAFIEDVTNFSPLQIIVQAAGPLRVSLAGYIASTSPMTFITIVLRFDKVEGKGSLIRASRMIENFRDG